MNRLIGLFLCVMTAGCAIPVRIVQEPGPVSADAIQQLGNHLNKSVVVTVGDEDYICVLVAADQDRIKVSSREEMREIPLNAIRNVRPDRGILAGSGRVTGLVVGGVTGALLGEAAADKAGMNTDGRKGAAATVAMAAGGALLGYVVVRTLGDADAIEVNPHLKTYTLDKAVGYSLTASEMQAYGIFTDLPLKAGEILLKAKVFMCEAGQYLVVYETHNGDVNGLSWECVDEEYVKQQKDKIRSLKQAKNIGMEE